MERDLGLGIDNVMMNHNNTISRILNIYSSIRVNSKITLISYHHKIKRHIQNLEALPK